MLVVGGAPAPPSPPFNISMAIDTSRRLLVGWTPPRGAVTGYLLEVGTSSERYDLGAFLLPPSPTFVTSGSVPPGIYYFRLRSVNAMGISVGSYEETTIVR